MKGESTMSNELIPYTPISITTISGQTFEVPAGGLGMFLNGGTEGATERIFRLVVGQPLDQRFKAGRNQFYLTRKVKEDSGDKLDENQGPFGAELRVVPIGYYLARAKYRRPYIEGDLPECASTNFLEPDLRYYNQTLQAADGAIVQCARCAEPRVVTDAQGNVVARQITDACPFARFGPRNPQTGKATKPECDKLYVVGVAVEVADDDGVAYLELAELTHKVSSARCGNTVTQQLAKILDQGLAPWQHPLDLKAVEAGQGNTFESVLRTDIKNTFSDEQLVALSALTARWNAHLSAREQRSKYVPEQETSAPNHTPVFPASAQPANTSRKKPLI
jgi:hypothetical protein